MNEVISHETYRAVVLSKELQEVVYTGWTQQRRCEPKVEELALELASCALRLVHALKKK